MKYFTINELCQSTTAIKKKINNNPTQTIKLHLTELVDTLLDPLREKWAEYCQQKGLGKASLIVSSGYRCPALNSAVGGVSTSAHLYGYGADIVPANGKQTEFEKFVSTIFVKSGVKFDQIIIEKSKSSRWIHFGLKNMAGKQRMQTFKLSVRNSK